MTVFPPITINQPPFLMITSQFTVVKRSQIKLELWWASVNELSQLETLKETRSSCSSPPESAMDKVCAVALWGVKCYKLFKAHPKLNLTDLQHRFHITGRRRASRWLWCLQANTDCLLSVLCSRRWWTAGWGLPCVICSPKWQISVFSENLYTKSNFY